jgi:putative endonuclease
MNEILSVLDPTKVPSPPLGERGEALAADYLKQNGYRIVVANFKVPIGRNTAGTAVTSEIDIIALEGETLCFVEVKTRRSDDYAPIIANVDARKQRQIIRTAKVYRRLFNIRDINYRYDVVTVLLPKSFAPTIELSKGYWNESKFRKRSWSDSNWYDHS